MATAVKQATLYGPNGQKKAVNVGSAEASTLQAQGWGLTPGSYKPVSVSAIDPLKIAAKYGYTAADFANDPNFASYWSNKSEAELTQALQRRTDFNQHSGNKTTSGEAAVVDGTQSWVDEQVEAGRITADQAAVIKTTLDNNDFTSGNKIPTDAEMQQMLADATTIATNSLNPYYERTTQRELSDLKTSLGDIRNESQRYGQQEAATYADTLAKAKQSLRARGMTFSGSSTAQLGNEGALVNEAGIEGSVPQARRYDWEDKLAGWQQKARDLGMATERDLGSAGISSNADYLNASGVLDPYGMTTGKTPLLFLSEAAILVFSSTCSCQSTKFANARYQQRIPKTQTPCSKDILYLLE